MKKIKVLNGFAGLGGTRWLWDDNNLDITAVEYEPYIANEYKRNFPNDTVVITDLYQYLLEHYQEFDFIILSPSCTSHSKLQKIQKVKKYPDFRLYELIVFLQQHFKGKWVVENVEPYYDYLINPNVIIERHPFWSNFPIKHIKMERYNVARSSKEYLSEWLGIPLPQCKNQRLLLRNCVHPKLGLHILNEFKKTIQKVL